MPSARHQHALGTQSACNQVGPRAACNQHAIRLDPVLHALADVSTDRMDAHAHIGSEGANAFPDRVDAIRGSSMQHSQTVADALAERLDTLPLIRANASPSMAN
jgi:hypothetical protein